MRAPIAVLCLCLSFASFGAVVAQPAASPQVAAGEQLFGEHCATCHGRDGRGGEGFQTPLWGERTQIAKFGTAQGLFEYSQLLMPFDDPAKLNDEQKWAITAFIAANHGALQRSESLSPQNAASVAIR